MSHSFYDVGVWGSWNGIRFSDRQCNVNVLVLLRCYAVYVIRQNVVDQFDVLMLC